MRINQVTITGSNFYGEKLQVNFSEKLNCLMGGRGSGKTTLLTLIYWGISEDAIFSREVLNLVRANLRSGVIEIIFSDEQGAVYKVTKSMGADPVIRTSDGKSLSLEEFRKKTTIQFFPAGSIEKIGIDANERLKLFDEYVGKEIEKSKNEIGVLVSQLKQNEFELKSSYNELFKLKEDQNNYGNLSEEITKARQELSAAQADSAVQAQFEAENKKQTARTLEQNFIERVKESITKVNEDNKRLSASLLQVQSLLNDSAKFESETVENFRSSAKVTFKKFSDFSNEISVLIKPLAVELVETNKKIKEEHLELENKFSDLKQTIAKHRELFQKINLLSQRETAQKMALELIGKAESQVKELGDSRNEILTKLNTAVSLRAELRRKKANEINDKLGGKVKILIKDSALNFSFQELLKGVITNAQMRTTTAEVRIIESSSPAELVKYFKENDSTTYASKLAIDKSRVDDLFSAIKDQQAHYNLEACVCEDSPNFFLAVEDAKSVESFRATEQLSTGQRCTAILPIIFALTSDPLLIDQPEDNLDNRYITQSIHHIVRNVKNFRQLIFVTHNPNIPVISESEFNAFLAYENNHSEIVKSGTVQAVKSQIVDLLEGGQLAFEKRKEIYGY